MPRIYKRNCDECKNYYEKASAHFCSRSCMGKNLSFRKRAGEKNKGKHPVAEFRKGNKPWNTGTRGIMPPPKNKGTHVQTNTGRTHIKKGQHIGVATQFKKGMQSPWKGKHRPEFCGEKGSNWKGGITNLGTMIRQCLEYRLWRSDCMMRDDFTCQECGVRGVKLHVDHMKPFALIIKENNIGSLQQALDCEELWSLNNGRTLCVPCHKKTDTYLKHGK